jgi:hypothetical protein
VYRPTSAFSLIEQFIANLSQRWKGFTEGFDTADLKEAKALLEELGGGLQ